MAQRSVGLLMTAVLLISACRGSQRSSEESTPGELFADRAADWGLDFVHFNGMSGELYFAEIFGAGAGLLDYDGDGDLDLYLVQGRMLGPGKTVADSPFPPRHELPLSDRLYRNDPVAAPGGGLLPRFTDVTAASGLRVLGYGMGVAAGDYDNDGWVDLYVTNLGPNELWRNNGDGTFREVTAAAGAGDARWSTSAAFFDYDDDGWLDLFVVNYTDFRVANHKRCTDPGGTPDYCGPRSYRPEADRLLHNRGDGTFEEVSARAGLLAEPAAGLGVVTADFDGDGRLDAYVANDQMQNQLRLNRGGGRFVDEALERGCAVNDQGRVEAGMGVDAADFDGDGDDDLFMTHLTAETNTLYLNDGAGTFTDRTVASGLAGPSVAATGFGTAFFDYDLDGRLDVIAVNGAVRTILRQRAAGVPLPLAQPNQLFRNLGGRFSEVSDLVPALSLPLVSRGAAVGDVDNDGAPDVLVSNNAAPAQLLANRAGEGAHWLGMRLVARAGRDAYGGRVSFHRAGAPPLLRRARSDGSYLSARDPRVLFGLGGGSGYERVEVRWPGGGKTVLIGLPVDRYVTLLEAPGGNPAGGSD